MPCRLLAFCLLTLGISAAELTVGPGKQFADLPAAVAAAERGDVVLVHPAGGDGAYRGVGVMVRTPELTIRAVPAKAGERVVLDGTGFDHSGVGRVPRAIVQFDPAAHGCSLEGFVLRGARNDSHNGAGVRVNQANGVTVKHCEITDCQMGVMSNGEVAKGTCDGLLVESCHVHHNGEEKHAGYNHNFYLGGTRVTLRGCDVHHPTTGHNVKSRAHLTIVEACFVHDSANREFDLVDAAGTTDVPGSHALIRGCLVVKARGMQGNKAVIHFGADGGKDHVGTLVVSHCTIITPYISPVIDLSAPGAKAALEATVVTAGAKAQDQVLLKARSGAEASLRCGSVVLGEGFANEGTRALLAAGGARAVFTPRRLFDDLHRPREPGIIDAVVAEEELVPWKAFGYDGAPPLAEYVAPASWRPRERVGKRWDMGCFEAKR